MKDNRDGSNLFGRRRALQVLGVGLTATGVFGIACTKPDSGGGGDAPKKAGGLTCDSPLDENSQTLRRTLQYHDRATDPEKRCQRCAQFQEGQYGECGGCKLIPGPVRPKGGCLSFAEKEGGAPPPI